MTRSVYTLCVFQNLNPVGFCVICAFCGELQAKFFSAARLRFITPNVCNYKTFGVIQLWTYIKFENPNNQKSKMTNDLNDTLKNQTFWILRYFLSGAYRQLPWRSNHTRCRRPLPLHRERHRQEAQSCAAAQSACIRLQLCHASEKAPNACNFCYRKCPRTCISHSCQCFSQYLAHT